MSARLSLRFIGSQLLYFNSDASLIYDAVTLKLRNDLLKEHTLMDPRELLNKSLPIADVSDLINLSSDPVFIYTGYNWAIVTTESNRFIVQFQSSPEVLYEQIVHTIKFKVPKLNESDLLYLSTSQVALREYRHGGLVNRDLSFIDKSKVHLTELPILPLPPFDPRLNYELDSTIIYGPQQSLYEILDNYGDDMILVKSNLSQIIAENLLLRDAFNYYVTSIGGPRGEFLLFDEVMLRIGSGQLNTKFAIFHDIKSDLSYNHVLMFSDNYIKDKKYYTVAGYDIETGLYGPPQLGNWKLKQLPLYSSYDPATSKIENRLS
jgi:hypothetical protein